MRLTCTAVAVLLLAACSTPTGRAPVAAPVASDRVMFLRDFRVNWPAPTLSDERILAAADGAVADLRAGRPWVGVLPAVAAGLPGVNPAGALSLIQALLAPDVRPPLS